MAMIGQHDLVGKLCNILGLDASCTKSLKIEIEPDCVIMVKVKKHLKESEMAEIIELFRLEKVELTKI